MKKEEEELLLSILQLHIWFKSLRLRHFILIIYCILNTYWNEIQIWLFDSWWVGGGWGGNPPRPGKIGYSAMSVREYGKYILQFLKSKTNYRFSVIDAVTDKVFTTNAKTTLVNSVNYITLRYFGGGYSIDWIRVRKYADIEPTITIEKAQALIPKPKLKLTINCDSLLKQGEIRTAELVIENVGNADAKDIVVTISSSSLGINVQKSYDLIPSKEARTVAFKVAPNEAGKFTVKAKVEYWDDKGNKYIETAEKTITVEATEVIAETPKGKSIPDFTILTAITALAVVLALRRLK